MLDLLIVDDESEFRDLMVRRFNQVGWRVQGAATGESALDLLSRREFDVAVLDMMLPGMTGLDLLGKIKEGPTDCEVVMLTGQATVRLLDLPREVTEPPHGDAVTNEPPTDDLAATQRSKVVSVLRRVNGNKSHAAKMLGIERRKLYRLVDRYQISDAEIAGHLASGQSANSTGEPASHVPTN